MPCFGLLLLLAAIPLTAQTPALDPKERDIVRQVDALNCGGLALLEQVVNINSGTLNLAGVRAVGMVYKAELDTLGFTPRWEDGSPYRRAGHLVAEKRGSGTRLLLIGHLDPVFEPRSPVPAVRAPRCGTCPRPRGARHEGRRSDHHPGAQGPQVSRPAGSDADLGRDARR